MVRCYTRMHKYFWSKHPVTGSNKIHKEIAALICHREGRVPHAVILGTGTLHRDNEACNHEGRRGQECNHVTCDGHAESIVYEGAPKYFMNQMVHSLKEGEPGDSIFEKIPSTEGCLMFRLKPNIKFYLIVTDPPCGFIQNQEDPCMEWKRPFVGFPHVPSCSSRILIGATMGIQGYVSHLLEKPIFIDSIIVLCTSHAEDQKTDFGNSFPLPKIKAELYQPKDFASFMAQNLIKRKDSQVASSIPDTSINPSSENNEAISKGSNTDGTKLGSLAVVSVYEDDGPSYLAINIRTGKVAPEVDTPIANKYINERLSVDRSVEEERKANMKKLYTGLCKTLNLENALLKLQHELESSIRRKKSNMEKWECTVSKELHNTLETPENLLQSEGLFNKKSEEERWVTNYKCNVEGKVHNIKEEMKSVFIDKEMLSNIKRILSNNNELIMDCTWHCYFKSPDDTHATDN